MDYKEEASKIKSRLKLGDKCRLLYGDGNWYIRGNDKAGLKSVEMHDGPCGLIVYPPVVKGEPKKGPLTSICFPVPALMANTFNLDLEAKVGRTMGMEARRLSTDLVLAPGVNIKRNPLCGRNFEYFSEDPYLAGMMGASFIKGMQSTGVGSCLKHFALNNQEFHRYTVSSEVDKRAMFDLYLKPFEIAVKEARPYAVMSSYNRINGVYASSDTYLLKEVLRDSWGFDGIIMSDWGGMEDSILSHNSSLNLEMPGVENLKNPLKRAVKKGKIDFKTFDQEVQELVELSLKVHDKPVLDELYDMDKGRKVALDAAEEGIVLAENKDHILPLSKEETIGVIGGLAKSPRYQGDGSSHVTCEQPLSLYDAILNIKKENVGFAQGYPLKKDEVADEYLSAALDLAAKVDKVVLAIGLLEMSECENHDRDTMKIRPEQLALLDAIYAINKNIVLVVYAGSPVELPNVSKAKAVVLAYLPGEKGSEALANVLLGKVNPSGHLSESWPYKYSDVPSAGYFDIPGDIALYKESIFVGYRYYLTTNTPVLYEFGRGLSYSEFSITDFKVSKDTLTQDDEDITIRLKVHNLSDIDGKAVVQIYLSRLNENEINPLRELVGFEKVLVKAKNEKSLKITLKKSVFERFSLNDNKAIIPSGKYKLSVGFSCSDIKDSRFINIESDDQIQDEVNDFPFLNDFRKGINNNYPSNELEKLLGHALPKDYFRRSKPFNMSNTFNDIASTKAGKRAIKYIRKKYGTGDRGNEVEMLLDSPIRQMVMSGEKHWRLKSYVDFANGKIFRGILTILFDHR